MGKGKKILFSSVAALIGVGAAKAIIKHKQQKNITAEENMGEETNSIKQMCKVCGDKSEFCGYDDYCGYNNENKKELNVDEVDDYHNYSLD
ncbi:hypothetical protein [Hathewaya massiliensis]|uniref:hypothetical protein n=1 Tax=Hathewaya massiliensis TaxID=1964382 RepID=UPI00115A0B76|nr:hypothetical protein [Hathewaya massiliensis]